MNNRNRFIVRFRQPKGGVKVTEDDVDFSRVEKEIAEWHAETFQRIQPKEDGKNFQYIPNFDTSRGRAVEGIQTREGCHLIRSSSQSKYDIQPFFWEWWDLTNSITGDA